MDASWVKLISNCISVVVPNEIPAVKWLGNQTDEPLLESLHLNEWAYKHSEVMPQVSSNDGV